MRRFGLHGKQVVISPAPMRSEWCRERLSECVIGAVVQR